MSSRAPMLGWLSGWWYEPSLGGSVDEAVIIIVDVAADLDVGVVADIVVGGWREGRGGRRGGGPRRGGGQRGGRCRCVGRDRR